MTEPMEHLASDLALRREGVETVAMNAASPLGRAYLRVQAEGEGLLDTLLEEPRFGAWITRWLVG